jgi:hypothetical protein
VITTYRGANYVDLRFDVDLDYDLASRQNRQFAIALPVPKGRQMYIDGAGFVMRVKQDLLPGGGAARYTPVHFTHLEQASDWGITIANRESAFVSPDLVFAVANEGRRTETREEGVQFLFRTEPRGSPVQSFHFRLAAQDENKWQWERFGAELNTPLRAVFADPPAGRPTRSFLEVNRPEVQVLAFKPAEFETGWYMLRLQEISGQTVAGVKLTTPFRLTGAVRADLVERRGESIDLNNFQLAPWETLTVLVRAR